MWQGREFLREVRFDRESAQQLNRAIPALDGHEASCYRRLLDMTVLILQNPEDVQPE